MVEPTDAILPILQRIQVDIAALTRDVAVLTGVVNLHTEKLGAIEDCLTCRLAITTCTKTGIR
jgi:hypothetical protein